MLLCVCVAGRSRDKLQIIASKKASPTDKIMVRVHSDRP
jgi:hypothetical protein